LKKVFTILAVVSGGLLTLNSQAAVATDAAQGFCMSVEQNFPRWDTNGDGQLSVAELDAAVASPQVTGDSAAAIAALKRATRALKSELPPLTQSNLLALATAEKSPFPKMFSESLVRIQAATNCVLFAAGPPELTTIRQGKLGNCFSLAPVGAMLQRNPAEMMEHFSTLTNGNYAVRIGARTVEVTPPTPAEIALTSVNSRPEIWLNVYEKAIGTARILDQLVATRTNSALDALGKGGSAGTMLASLTGKEIRRFSFKFAKGTNAHDTAQLAKKLSELREQLTAATAQNILMTCGTLKVTTPDLTPNHAYAVLGYETKTDLVRLWNPHGQNFQPNGAPSATNGYPTAHGVFALPVTEYVRQFSGMAFEVPAP